MNPFHPLRTVAAALALGALTALGSPAMAQAGNDTLAKIRNSGKAVIGVREASPPMAYALGANTNFTGYHVELCERIIRKLVPQARLEYFAMTPQNTMPLVQNGTVDIGCGPATNNLTRQQQVMMASGEMAGHYDKWFMQPIPPRNVALNLPLSDELKALFAQPNDDPIESYNKR